MFLQTPPSSRVCLLGSISSDYSKLLLVCLSPSRVPLLKSKWIFRSQIWQMLPMKITSAGLILPRKRQSSSGNTLSIPLCFLTALMSLQILLLDVYIFSCLLKVGVIACTYFMLSTQRFKWIF